MRWQRPNKELNHVSEFIYILFLFIWTLNISLFVNMYICLNIFDRMCVAAGKEKKDFDIILCKDTPNKSQIASGWNNFLFGLYVSTLFLVTPMPLLLLLLLLHHHHFLHRHRFVWFIPEVFPIRVFRSIHFVVSKQNERYRKPHDGPISFISHREQIFFFPTLSPATRFVHFCCFDLPLRHCCPPAPCSVCLKTF